ncbi:VCBS domain-containing protein [Falsiruegeria mediterranea]|uniref:VCBS domain-containing protein n=1 Tax=Falsiruegeria mediterranea TaxID=1280832 RepID=UPI001401C05C|nr:VCBS domain-containing protein [Falsiruegeria mediterranea]
MTGGQPNGPAIAGFIPSAKEGNPVPIVISVVNGNNTLNGSTVTLGGLPPGTTLDQGHAGQGGTWVLGPGTDLKTLTMTPPTDWFGSGHIAATVVDPNGHSAQIQMPFTVQPQPDAAKITGTDSGTASEDHVLSVSGALTVIDPDPGEAHFHTAALTGSYGRVQIDRSGHWTYVLNNSSPSVQALVSGQSEHETFTIHSVDGTSHQLVVIVMGTDDKAAISGTAVGAVTEDKLTATGGKLDVTDPDAGQASFVPQTGAAGAHGSFTVQPDGTWSYTLDNGQPAVQALKTGDQITDTLTVSTVDGTTKQITVTINGTDDKAAISGTAVGAVTEDKLTATGGKLDVTDPDAGQASFVPQTGAAGAHGSFTVQPDGTWSYTLDNGQPAVQALKTGDQITDTLTVSTVDGTTKQITVTINGTDDKAAISGTAVGAVTEDKLTATGGKLDVTDPDAGQASFVPQTGAAGAHGSFTVQPDGTWSYTLDNGQPAVQALKTGDQITDTLTVSTVDGTTKQIQITIHGTNDAPVLSTATASATEDGSSVTGQMSATDVDTGDTLAYSLGQTAPAGFTLNADGSWSFDPTDGAYQHLAAGATQQLTIPVTVTDKTGATDTENLVITVTGTNDGPAVSGPVTLPGGTEDKAVQITAAQLLEHATDIDTGDALSVTGLTASHGTISGDAANGFTFTPDPNYNGPVALSYTVTDGHGGNTAQTANLTLAAVGDAAVITASVPQLKEDRDLTGFGSGAELQATGHFHVTDPDGPAQSQFVPHDVNGLLQGSFGGTLQIYANGKYYYHLPNVDVDYLKDGESVQDRFTIDSVDGTTQEVVFTIHGTSDAPVIYSNRHYVFEDNHPLAGQVGKPLTDRISADDADKGDTAQLVFKPIAQVPGFSLKPDGSYTFDASNSAYQYLSEGQKHTVSIPFSVTDPDGHTSTGHLTIKVEGTNDVPSIDGSSVTTGTVTEDASSTRATGTMSASDVDAGSRLHWAAVGSTQGHYGSFAIDAHTGQWTYTLDNSLPATQQLSATDQPTENFRVAVIDEHGAQSQKTVVVTVSGTNDGPAVSGPVTLPGGTEDKAVQITAAQLLEHATDVDTGDQLSVTGLTASHGTISGDAANGFTFTPDPNYNGPVSLSYTVTDGHGGSVAQKATIALAARDDPAVVSGTDTGDLTEDKNVGPSSAHPISVGGTLSVSDPDGAASNHFSYSIWGEHAVSDPFGGSLHMDRYGNWHYAVDNSHAAVQRLAAGEEGHATYRVSTADGTTHQIQITIHGTNDAPVLSAATASATEDGSSVTGQMSATDVDTGDTLAYSLGQTAPAGFTLNGDGSWSFDPTDGAYQHLAAGATQQLTIPVTVADKTGATDTENLVITVTGTNDGPAVSGPVTLPGGTEDKAVQITAAQLLEHATDIDTGDQLSVTGLTASHGTISGDAANGFTFTPDPNYNGPVALSYQVTDGHGGTVAQTANLTLAAVGDAAIIGGVDTGDVTENTAGVDMSPDYAQPGMATLQRSVLSADGKLTILDPDAGEAEFDTVRPGINYHGTYGDLYLKANGEWHYYGDAGHLADAGARPTTRGTAIDQLGVGQTLTDTITVHSKDGTPHDIVITIHGSNDRPYCSSEVTLRPGTEDVRQTLTTTQLLANTVDVDANDAGKLSIENLHPDHGSIRDNGDGTFTFTPGKDYSGAVHFTYDVKDAHGGVTHTGATTTLAAVGDAAVITGTDTGSATEDKVHGRIVISGDLDVTDPDGPGQEHFQYSQFGEHAVSDPFGGSLHISSAGTWSYVTDNSNAAVQQLAAGQVGHATYRVSSADGTTHQIQITIHGTNDAPVLSASTASATEDGSAVSGQMSATDVDTGDTLAYSLGQAAPAGFALNADGSWSFDPTDAAYQHLAAGATEQVTIPVTVTDGTDTDTQNLTITVTGTNDAAVYSGSTTGSITEDQLSRSGRLETAWHNLDVTDPDTGEGQVVAIEVGGVLHQLPANFASTIQGTYGSFHTTHGTDGHDKWMYFADNGNPAIQGLKAGENLGETAVLVTQDGTRVPISVTIQGHEDGVVIDTPASTAGWLGEVVEDSKTQVSGQLQAHDTDTHDSVSFTTQTTTNAYGTFTVDASGHWAFALDNNAVQNMRAGQRHAMGFDIEAVSTDGSKAMQHVEIFARGTNDAPVLSASTAYATEDGQRVTGRMSATDVDTGDTQRFSIAQPVDGFTMNQDGSWSFDPTGAAYQNIPDGQTRDVTIAVTVADKAGATDTRNLVITVTGTNDSARIAGVDTGHVTEDVGPGHHTSLARISTSGTLTITDPDAGEAAFTPVAGTAGAGTYGSFTLDANGNWTYTADNSQAAVQGLGTSSPPLTDTLTITSIDGTQHTLTVTIHGTNDAPVLSAATASATEDGSAVSGQMSATDVDAGDTLAYSLGQAAPAGFALNADGSWSFDPTDAAYQHLAAGQTEQVTIPVTVTDGTATDTQNLVISVTGTNDLTVFGGVQTGTTHEDGNDVQLFGSTYKHDATDWQRFTVHDADGPVSQLQIEFGGKIAIWDMQSDLDVATPYGKFQFVHADGQGVLSEGYYWNYIGDNKNAAVQALKAGEALPPEQITLISPDGVRFPLTVTVQGAEDGVRIDTSGTIDHVIEQGPSTPVITSGQLQAHDIDTSDSVSWQATPTGGITGHLGTFTVDASGHWEYQLDPAKAAMLGDKMQFFEHFSIVATSTDGSKANQQVSVQVVGTNQAPSLSAMTASATEDGSRVTGQMSATDVDTGDTQAYSLGQAAPAGFTLNGDGSWSFDPTDAAYQHLAAGATEQVTIPVTVTDGTDTDTQNLTITVTGTNDAAVYSGSTTGSITEDQLSRSGRLETAWHNLDVTDPDTGEGQVVAIEVGGVLHQLPANFASTIQGTYGSFHTTHGTDGHDKWMYFADNGNPAIQGLKAGENLGETAVLVTQDGTRVPISVTIQGHEDGVVIDTPASTAGWLGEVVEDSKTQVSGQLQAHDTDTHDSVSFTPQTTTNAYGTFTVDASGHWAFALDNNAVQNMRAGQRHAMGFDIEAVSTDGSKAMQHVEIFARGTNDAPVLSASTAYATEDGQRVTGRMSATDVDTGDTQRFSIAQPVDGFTMNQDGSWSFDPTGAAYQNIPDGQTRDVTIAVTVADKAGATDTRNLVITVTGTNDSARIAGVDTGHVTEDVGPGHHTSLARISTSGTLTITDPDAGEAAFTPVAGTAGAGTYGSFTLDANGNWTYTADNSQAAVQGLGTSSPPLTDTLTITSIDGTQHTLTVTIHGTNDAPVLSAATASATEDGSTVSGQMSATDTDKGDALTYSLGQAAPAGFTLNPDGSWSFDPKDAAYQHLAASATEQVTIPVTVTDGTDTDSRNLVITVTGTNDGPVVHPGDLGATQPGANKTWSPADLLAAIHATDVDQGDQLSVSNIQVDARYGSFHQTGGNWVFTPTSGANQTDVPVTISVTDGHETRSTTATLDVTAAPTPPKATQVQGSGTTHLSGTLTGGSGGWSIDNGQGHGVLSLQGQYGTLTINPQNGHFEYNYRADSAVIKQGGGGTTSGRHTDTFRILQHGTHTSDAEVQVNINVQSVHGNSGHHVDHTTLLGIDIVPVTPSQHNAPSYDEPAIEVTVDMDPQDPNDEIIGLSDVVEASVAQRSEVADAEQSQGTSPENEPTEHSREAIAGSSQDSPTSPYLDAIGGGVGPDASSQTPGVDHANPYVSALGVDALSPGDTPVLDPTTLDDPMVSGNAEPDAQNENVEPDLPMDDPIVHLPEDDDPSTNSG